MSSGEPVAPVDAILQALGDQLDYGQADRSFSPFYSDVGLGFVSRGGIDHLYVHYNRRTTALGDPFLALPSQLTGAAHAPLHVEQRFEAGKAQYVFYGHDSWLVATEGLPVLAFQLTDPALEQKRQLSADGTDSRTFLFAGYLSNQDPRDPDRTVPVLLGLRVVIGQVTQGDGLEAPLTVAANDSSHIVLAFSIRLLDVVPGTIVGLLQAAPDLEEAKAKSYRWFRNAVGDLTYQADDAEEAEVLARAAFTLAFNASEAPGYLSGRVAAFPSRGGYPTHFLWDSCFQNLALEQMDPRLAPDSLLLLTENLRVDGKMMHFLCSTWGRPHETQPPLVGWAGWRLAQKRNDPGLARALLHPLLRNNQWWLTQRMSRYGLLYCPHPLETGWDDTPRMDEGPILALDMNSYFLVQLRACARLARLIGEDDLAEQTEAQSDAFAARMVEVFYDAQANLFRDVLLATGEQLSIKTPACFLPLWAHVPLDARKAKGMIEEYLLNPGCFFGIVPFPCVAYDEPTYQPGKWWRGPTWLPVAYLMLELLSHYGYHHEWREAASRLYRVVVQDGRISEYFDSQTGKGGGNAQQGWTAAILLQLKSQLQATSDCQ